MLRQRRSRRSEMLDDFGDGYAFADSFDDDPYDEGRGRRRTLVSRRVVKGGAAAGAASCLVVLGLWALDVGKDGGIEATVVASREQGSRATTKQKSLASAGAPATVEPVQPVQPAQPAQPAAASGGAPGGQLNDLVHAAPVAGENGGQPRMGGPFLPNARASPPRAQLRRSRPVCRIPARPTRPRLRNRLGRRPRRLSQARLWQHAAGTFTSDVGHVGPAASDCARAVADWATRHGAGGHCAAGRRAAFEPARHCAPNDTAGHRGAARPGSCRAPELPGRQLGSARWWRRPARKWRGWRAPGRSRPI